MSKRETKLISKHIVEGPAFDVHVHVEQGLVQHITLHPNSGTCLCWHLWSSEEDSAIEELLKAWFLAYGQGKQPSVAVPFNFTSFSPFTTVVLQLMQTIPFGSALSYGEMAKLAGSPLAARAVGSVCRRNPFPLLIPCHRIVGSKGSLGGYSAGCGMQTKTSLLKFENYLSA